jgi:DNA-binding GntR family transcriptional regulator
MTLGPIETVSAVDAVAVRLRDRVLGGDLEPGYPVTEHDVAAQYGVARPTAKSAITVLTEEGLLHREANKPAKVPTLSSDDVADLFLVRIPLELEAVRLIAERKRIPAGLAEALHEVHTIDESPPGKHAEVELRFHRLLVDSVASRRLTRVYRVLLGETHLSMVQSQQVLRAEHFSREHGLVLDAICAGETTRAIGLMRKHLQDVCHDIAADHPRT